MEKQRPATGKRKDAAGEGAGGRVFAQQALISPRKKKHVLVKKISGAFVERNDSTKRPDQEKAGSPQGGERKSMRPATKVGVVAHAGLDEGWVARQTGPWGHIIKDLEKPS